MNGLETQVKEVDSLLEVLDDLDARGIFGAERKQICEHYLGYCARKGGVPLSGSFELTPLCNFDCKMCYVHLAAAQMGKEQLLTGQQWQHIIAQAVDAGMLYADVTGGECLTHPDFREIYLSLLSRGVQVSILTNGSLITEDMADFLAKYPPTIVQITLYASNSERYIRVTGRDAFSSVMEAIKRLRKRGIPMRLTVTPNRFMAGDEEALLRLIKALGVPYGIGGITLPPRPETERHLEDYVPDNEVFVTLFRREKELFRQDGTMLRRKQVIYVPRDMHSRRELSCGAGNMSFHINWRGEMTPCIPFHTVRRSVQRFGFAEAWSWIGEQMQDYRMPQACKTCKLRKHCQTCATEKTMGALDGEVNRAVCSKLQRYLDEGIVAADFEDCRL